jgi:predicted transcriptional regulator
METLIKKIILLLVAALPLTAYSSAPVDSVLLPDIVLKGKDGGLHDNSEWRSTTLKNNINLLFYVDPDKQRQIKPLLARIDSLSFSHEVLRKTFVLNVSATMIPDFILLKKVAKRAKTAQNLTYVFDNEKVLVKKWNLVDDDINILLFDSSGYVVYKHSGEITHNNISHIISKIKELSKKENSHENQKN